MALFLITLRNELIIVRLKNNVNYVIIVNGYQSNTAVQELKRTFLYYF